MKYLIFLCFFYLASASEKCCPDVGCFSGDYPFDHMPLPNCAEDLKPSMIVYTRNNPNAGQPITRTTIPPALNENRRTIFIVHGWLGSRNNQWLETMKDLMLVKGDYNVVLVGWDGGSQNIWYPQSASDTRTIGAEIAYVTDQLKTQLGMTVDQFYCTGHSLGSHICGHAGARSHFGRITGMDPAGPWFEGKDLEVGLNPSCADFVDVIHTNGIAGIILNLGTMRILGHADFYPHGGRRQPGCILDPRNPTSEEELEESQLIDLMPACSHMRVLNLYGESISMSCFGVRYYDCTDRFNLPGSCQYSSTPVQQMGFDADQFEARGIFYIETERDSPFCQG